MIIHFVLQEAIPYKRDEKMYLDLYNDEEEYILSYYKRHRHYGNFADSLNYLFDDIKGILENKKCVVITNSKKRWLTELLKKSNFVIKIIIIGKILIAFLKNLLKKLIL